MDGKFTTYNNNQTSSSGALCEQQETLGFMDSDSSVMAKIPTSVDTTVHQDDGNTADLSSFLARPVRIYNKNAGSDFNEYIKPWHLWASNSRIKSKLDNFYMFRGNLMLKVVINGAPYFQGRYMCSYQPLSNENTLQSYSTSNTLGYGWLMRNIAHSQRLHIRLNPTTGQGGCLCLPFFWPRNYIKIPDISEWQDLGELCVESVSPYVNSSGTGSPHISIYAWCENAELHVPTVSSAVSESDEYEQVAKTGTISGPASALAGIAGMFTSVPIIKPFALATQIGAGAVGSIAKLFGYSKPVDPSIPQRMIDFPAGMLAHTSGGDTVAKLTLDPKQGITIDPRVVGLGAEDEMVLLSIAQKESIMSYFTWDSTQNPDTVVFWAAVNPMTGLHEIVDPGIYIYFQPTAIAFASQNFRYWSGSIKYRFEFVANAFSRGRLLLTWDPHSYANAATSSATNVMYSKLIDLEETRNFELIVPWGVPEPYKDVWPANTPVKNQSPYTPESTPNAQMMNDYFNGIFTLQVVNPLSSVSGLANPTCQVNVFISAGDDFEVRAPDSRFVENISYHAYGESEEPTMVKDPGQDVTSDPVDTVSLIPGAPSKVETKSAVFFGDPIVSFRTLLKRYNFSQLHWMQFTFGGVAVGIKVQYTLPDFPAYGGYDTSGLYRATNATTGPQYTPAFTTLLNFLTPAYAGWRGSIRHKYVLYRQSNPNSDGHMTYLRAYRRQDQTIASLSDELTITNVVAANANPITEMFVTGISTTNAIEGEFTTNVDEQSNIMIELPFYSKHRFRNARDITKNTSHAFDDDGAFHNIEFGYVHESSGTPIDYRLIGYRQYVSTGEDFNLHYFVNAPLQTVDLNGRPTTIYAPGAYTP